MVSNDNVTFVGDVSRDERGVLFTVERRLTSVSFKLSPGGLLALTRIMLGFRRRLATEAARRGQPVPVVRLPEEQSGAWSATWGPPSSGPASRAD